MSNLTVISDPGVDDLVALALLDKLTRNQPKALVSTFGNNSIEITSKNARSFAAYMGGDWSYRDGVSLPLKGEISQRWLDSDQGTDGLWGCRPVTDRAITTDGGRETGRVISLAPLTEAYKIMQFQSIKELTIMGGLFTSLDKKQVAELNIRLDVPAAKWVFENCRDSSVMIIPADVAESVRWTKKDVLAIPETNETNKWLKHLLLAGYENKRYGTGRDFILYDPLAIYLAFKPQAARWERRGVAVVGMGDNAGRTVFSDDNPPCNIAVGLKEQDKAAQEIFSLLFEESGNGG